MSRDVHVTKMSGAGNDFIVMDAEAARRLEGPATEWIRRACRRGLSIGSDGVLVVEPRGDGRVRVRFSNPDASEAFCGNGTRCAARFAYLRGMAGARMTLETVAGDVPATVNGDRVELVLPAPDRAERVTLADAAGTVEGWFVMAGSPHFVTFVESVADFPLHDVAPRLRRDPMFGEAGTNVNCAERCTGMRLRLRTWERGVEGETLACGSGAVAAAYAALLEGGARQNHVVPASGVTLDVTFSDPAEVPQTVRFGGDARIVFEAVLGADVVDGF